MSDKKSELPYQRLFIYPEDIARMRGCSIEAATALYHRIRRKLRKKKGAELTYREYCLYIEVREEEVVPYLYIPIALKLVLAASVFWAFSIVPKNYFPWVKYIFGKKEETVNWEATSPTYQRGVIEKLNDKGELQKIIVEIDSTGDE